MDRFKLILAQKAVKDLDDFSDSVCKRITNTMRILQENPFPKGKLIKKIKGIESDFYRLRVDKYRVFYIIEGDKVVVLRILSKKDAGRFIRNLN